MDVCNKALSEFDDVSFVANDEIQLLEIEF